MNEDFRYEVSSKEFDYTSFELKKEDEEIEITLVDLFRNLFNMNNNKYPDSSTYNITKWSIFIFSK